MRPITWLGILLALLGVLALAYQGFNYTRQEKVFDVGPIHATAERHERVSIPPLLGGLALLGGVALLVVGAKRSS
jgi:drug/metabolite transporter (DMT)-like permease